MTGLIILAAGQSSRLGQPKQNLIFQNKTLLQRAIDTALASECRPIIVITGCNAKLVEHQIINPEIEVAFNAEWEEGIASSIRTGIAMLQASNNVDAALIMLCDQPLVTPSLLTEMLQKQAETGRSIIACTYNETVGVPVLFNRSMFGELMLLQGDEGARKILKKSTHEIGEIPFKDGVIDVDTMEDYERLINH